MGKRVMEMEIGGTRRRGRLGRRLDSIEQDLKEKMPTAERKREGGSMR